MDIPKATQFRMETNKGLFYVYVEAQDATKAEDILRERLQAIKDKYGADLFILTLKTLKRGPGVGDNSISIWEGGRFSAGKDLWVAVGQGKEYEKYKRMLHKGRRQEMGNARERHEVDLKGGARMKVIYSTWFTSLNGYAGIVIGEAEDGKRKAYIGIGDGIDEKADERFILEWGAKLPPDLLRKVLALLTIKAGPEHLIDSTPLRDLGSRWEAARGRYLDDLGDDAN